MGVYQTNTNPMPSPSIARRLGASLYEFVLLFGIFFVTGLLLQIASTITGSNIPDWIKQWVLFCVLGIYFTYCWTHSGQTLAQKTWHIRIASNKNSTKSAINYKQAWLRYVFACVLGILPALLTIFVLRHSGNITSAGAGYLYGLGFLLVLANWLTLLGTSLMNRDRRALHEVLSGTCSVFGKGF